MEEYKQLIEVSQQIKVLEDKRKQLTEVCLADMVAKEEKTAKFDNATISLMERTSYKFTEETTNKTTELKEQIKQMEAKEIEDGKAEEKVSQTLRLALK